MIYHYQIQLANEKQENLKICADLEENQELLKENKKELEKKGRKLQKEKEALKQKNQTITYHLETISELNNKNKKLELKIEQLLKEKLNKSFQLVGTDGK